ncbi:MAG: hypothetical protein Q3Y08_03780 [Butyricicoccus sp.]|nr:hypothetical protein [Butyricicoccus sp.]
MNREIHSTPISVPLTQTQIGAGTFLVSRQYGDRYYGLRSTPAVRAASHTHCWGLFQWSNGSKTFWPPDGKPEDE